MPIGLNPEVRLQQFDLMTLNKTPETNISNIQNYYVNDTKMNTIL